MALGLGNPVLANLIEQRLVTDLQQRRRLLAIPIGFVERLADRFSLGSIFGGAGQRLQPSG